MLSAGILAALGHPAMPLARQLAHQRCVRPGPLVLGAAPLKSPTPTTDRDRQSVTTARAPCPNGGQVISAWLCMSPCRSDHIFTTGAHPSRASRCNAVFGVWSLRILVPTPRWIRRYLPPPFMEMALARSLRGPPESVHSPADRRSGPGPDDARRSG